MNTMAWLLLILIHSLLVLMAQSAPSSHNTEDQDGVSGEKHKLTQMAAKLVNQIEKTLEKLEQKKSHEEDYSV